MYYISFDYFNYFDYTPRVMSVVQREITLFDYFDYSVFLSRVITQDFVMKKWKELKPMLKHTAAG